MASVTVADLLQVVRLPDSVASAPTMVVAMRIASDSVVVAAACCTSVPFLTVEQPEFAH